MVFALKQVENLQVEKSQNQKLIVKMVVMMMVIKVVLRIVVMMVVMMMSRIVAMIDDGFGVKDGGGGDNGCEVE